MKRLIILDLDNTLIYATYEVGLSAKILFWYSKSIIVYERNFAREFIQKCHEAGDVIVFTTAVRDYAEKIIQHLNVQPLEVYTREDCLLQNEGYIKSIPHYYFEVYDEIIIVDDYPDAWDRKTQHPCIFLVPSPYMGDYKDNGLKLLMDKLDHL